MSDQIIAGDQKLSEDKSTAGAAQTEGGPAYCPVEAKAWLKGALGMTLCCAAPLLLFAAIAFFGLSVGAVTSGALSIAALLACPVGMFLMMRLMMKDKG